MKPLIAMRAALSHPDLFGQLLGGDSWASWRTLLIAICGEELTPEERQTFRDLTGGREVEPGRMVEEAWLAIGRRGGKSRAISILAVWLSACCEHPVIVAGETAVLPILSASMVQSQIVFKYIIGTFEALPELRGEVVSVNADTIALKNGVAITVRAASYRTIRGVTAIAAICDEIATWRNSDDSSNPDREILRALRPALSTTHGPLICISSPYAKMGELWEAYRRDFGPDGDPLILVAQAASRVMNPTLSQARVDREYAKDAESASAEYGAQFRGDIGAFVAREAVEACVDGGVYERPPIASVSYVGFADPSGGSADAMTMSIGHREGEQIIIDVVRERRPAFSPEDVSREFASLFRAYRVTKIQSDRYAGLWPAEMFRRFGVECEQSARPKTELYLDLLPAINSGSLRLLDIPRLVSQLCGLERRTARSGRDSIAEPRGQFDDVANAVAGVVAMLGTRSLEMNVTEEIIALAADPRWRVQSPVRHGEYQQRQGHFFTYGR
jgi:hypothetical protein